MHMFDKEAMHQKSVGETRRTNDDHWKAVVSDVSEMCCTDNVVDQQTDRMIELEGIDCSLIFL